jgi:hypothetical protein
VSKLRISAKDAPAQIQQGLLLQSDPTLLDTNRELFKAIPLHDIVFARLDQDKHREELQKASADSVPLKSFLHDLPYDILGEIVRHCGTKGMKNIPFTLFPALHHVLTYFQIC